MKIDQLPYSAMPPHAVHSSALPDLFQLLHYKLAPDNIPALVNSGELPARVNDVKMHCENLTRELFSFSCYSIDSSVHASLRGNWCAVNTLLDITYSYIKRHPGLKANYQPAMDAIVQVYDFFDTHFKHLYPVNSKMPDIIVDKYIGTMKSGYQKLLSTHNNNGMLKALLHPVWEVIKHTGRGNNTFHRVTYAFHLLGRVKLWHQHKGTYDQLCDIAISMNINSPAFLQYLASMGKNVLATYTDERGRQQQLNDWQAQYRETLWVNTHTTARESYNKEEQPVAAFLRDWLKEQKEFLELSGTKIDEKVRLEIAHDLEFFCWDTRIKIEAGYYKSNIVKPIVLALADIISTPGTPEPSQQSIERLIKGIEIPWATRDKLDKHLTQCLKLLFKYPVKGGQPVKNKLKATKPPGKNSKAKPRGK